MCPENATPDCVMTLFCTGAVTSACAVPATQSSVARRNIASTYAALRVSSVPAVTGAVSASGNTCRLPAAWAPTAAELAARAQLDAVAERTCA